MNNVYAVVRNDLLDNNGILSFHNSHKDAYTELQTLRILETYPLSVPLSIMKAAFTSIPEEPEDRVERLEHEVRTLRTLLTSLQGRVAELNKVSTPPF